MKGNRLVSTIFVLAVLAACIAAVPAAAFLGISFLYLEPNPRHLPTVLTGEAIGWAIIGLLTGASVVTISESLFWPNNRSFFERHRGLILGAAVSLVAGIALGIFFAIIQMDSVDGQAMETRQLAILAGATAAGLATIAGIVAGHVGRQYVVGLYRLPASHQPSRITFNDEDATGAHRAVSERSGHAGEHA